MGLNRDFLGREFEPVVREVTMEDIRNYAWAIGARNLTYFNYNGALNPSAPAGMAPPSFPVIYELPILEKIWSDPELHGGEDEARKNVMMLVHGDQKMWFYKPVKPGDKLTFRTKITDIEDKGSGELLVFRVVANDESGDSVAESEWGLFIRGIGSGKRPSKKTKKKEVFEQERELVFRKVIRVDNDITYRYAEASNDSNPIHIDENVAKAAGLKGIIVHGLCTMSMTMRAIIECYLDSNPSFLDMLSARFTAPVYPGDTLVADGWEVEKQKGRTLLGFEVIRRDDSVKVIKNGTAEVSL